MGLPHRPPRGALAQLGERLICIQEVIGSIPIGSTSSSLQSDQTAQVAFGFCAVSSDWTEIDIVERETSVSLVAPCEVLLTVGRKVCPRSDIVPSQVH